MDRPDTSAVARMEHAWRSRGLRVFSAVAMLTVGGYSVLNLVNGSLFAAVATGIGVPVAAWSWALSKRDPMPAWAPAPVMGYLLAVLAALLLTEHEGSAPVMFLAAGPALAIFGFGARWGLTVSGVILIMMLGTLGFATHPLPAAYSTRFVVAFVFTAVVAYMYERMRETAVHELARASQRIETLESLLPMCAWCGKVDKEDGEDGSHWVPIEEYLEDTDRPVTHGLCPDCYRKELERVNREIA